MRVELSPAAATDLDEIWFYGAEQWSVKQANLYQDKLIAAAYPPMYKPTSLSHPPV